MIGREVLTLNPYAREAAVNFLLGAPAFAALVRSSTVEGPLDVEAIEAAGGILFDDVGVVVWTPPGGAGPADAGSSPVTQVVQQAVDMRLVIAREPEPVLRPLCKPYDPNMRTFDNVATWGMHATAVVCSPYTGANTALAILDTGYSWHPDFAHRSVTARSFVSRLSVDDPTGHGTHCLGTACGLRSGTGYRYGIATAAKIFCGKVVDSSGEAPALSVMIGIWSAVKWGADVISISLGNGEPSPSPGFTAFGAFALSRDCLIVAGAGNNGNGSVGQPANSPTVMAVGAIDRGLTRSPSSARSGTACGSEVDLVAPGVDVWSSWLNRDYYRASGTSTAAPHVAGIALLWKEATLTAGPALWATVVYHALSIPGDPKDVGAGLAQAPIEVAYPYLRAAASADHRNGAQESAPGARKSPRDPLDGE